MLALYAMAWRRDFLVRGVAILLLPSFEFFPNGLNLQVDVTITVRGIAKIRMLVAPSRGSFRGTHNYQATLPNGRSTGNTSTINVDTVPESEIR